MRFKKIYIEITNNCNLNCSFCHNNSRSKQFMSVKNFEYIISEIKKYTNYVYLHVKGEPLLHPNLKEILEICKRNNIKVNITTNGTLIKKQKEIILNSSCVRQLNFSLHSENNISTYFEDIFCSAKELSTKMFISYRLWTLNDYKLDKKSTEIVKKIINSYNLSPEIVDKIYKENSIKISFNTFVNKDNLFQWPDLNSAKKNNAFCHGLKTHIGILVDGTIVPCCLDGEGIINLGNIFEESLSNILHNNRTMNVIKGFENNKCVEELCSRCAFKNRFNSK